MVLINFLINCVVVYRFLSSTFLREAHFPDHDMFFTISFSIYQCHQHMQKISMKVCDWIKILYAYSIGIHLGLQADWDVCGRVVANANGAARLGGRVYVNWARCVDHASQVCCAVYWTELMCSLFLYLFRVVIQQNAVEVINWYRDMVWLFVALLISYRNGVLYSFHLPWYTDIQNSIGIAFVITCQCDIRQWVLWLYFH